MGSKGLADEELATLAREAGTNDSFAELFVRHRKKVFCACRGFFADSQAAEDATQETFLRAFRNIQSFQEGDFSRWLMRIAKNVCIDEWRRSRRESGAEGLDVAEKVTSSQVDSSFQIRFLAEQVQYEIRFLPSDQRRCLEMKIEGFSYEETAARTGLTVNAVKSNIQNGRRMLWQKLARVTAGFERPKASKTINPKSHSGVARGG